MVVPRLALTHATVLTMDGRGALPGHTVVIQGGQIAEVRPSAEHEPVGTEVFDARGSWVLPGLADMHAHVGDRGEWPLWLANGVTTVRNMWGSPLHLDLARDGLAGDGWPGPRVVTASPIADGGMPGLGTPRYPGLTIVDDPADAAAVVKGWAEAGYRMLKVYSDLRPDVLAALAAAAREHRLPVVGHCPRAMTVEQAIRAGMAGFEHLAEYENGHLLGGARIPADAGLVTRLEMTAAHADWQALGRLAGLLASEAIWSCPTLTVWTRITVPSREIADDPGLRYVPAAARRLWSRTAVRGPDPGQVRSAAARHAGFRGRLVRTLFAEGAPLLAGTDAGSRYTVPGFSLHEELAGLTAAGIGARDVLRMATVDAARCLGEQDLWGTVAAGRRADLIVAAGDPRADLGVLRTPVAVVAGGRLHTAAGLAAALRQRAVTADAVPDQGAGSLGPMATRTWYARADRSDT